jgi:hypothetical protein
MHSPVLQNKQEPKQQQQQSLSLKNSNTEINKSISNQSLGVNIEEKNNNSKSLNASNHSSSSKINKNITEENKEDATQAPQKQVPETIVQRWKNAIMASAKIRRKEIDELQMDVS